MCPGLLIVESNLRDLTNPVAERHGPATFDLSEFLSSRSMTVMLEQPTNVRQASGPMQRFAKQNPGFEQMLPVLFARGAEAACRIAAMFAIAIKTPSALDALRDFVRSSRGSDAMRVHMAMTLRNLGELPDTINIYASGECIEIQLMAFEVYSEPKPPSNRTDRVHDLANKGFALLNQGDGVGAEQFYRKAIGLESDAPDLYNNLAMALHVQDRDDEADEIILAMHHRWPDYFFGRIAMANLATIRSDFESAAEFLKPLCELKSLHTTELVALCQAQVQLATERGEPATASRWLSVWKTFTPEHPDLARWERPRMTSLLSKLLSQD